MFDLQSVLLFALDVVKGPYVHCSFPVNPFCGSQPMLSSSTASVQVADRVLAAAGDTCDDTLGSRTMGPSMGSSSMDDDDWFRGICDVFVPRSEFCCRVSWLYEAESGRLFVYYPEEIPGEWYARKTLRYTLCLVFVIDPVMTVGRGMSEAFVAPFSVALANIAEELRAAELKYRYMSKGIERVQMLARSSFVTGGTSHTQPQPRGVAAADEGTSPSGKSSELATPAGRGLGATGMEALGLSSPSMPDAATGRLSSDPHETADFPGKMAGAYVELHGPEGSDLASHSLLNFPHTHNFRGDLRFLSTDAALGTPAYSQHSQLPASCAASLSPQAFQSFASSASAASDGGLGRRTDYDDLRDKGVGNPPPRHQCQQQPQCTPQGVQPHFSLARAQRTGMHSAGDAVSGPSGGFLSSSAGEESALHGCSNVCSTPTSFLSGIHQSTCLGVRSPGDGELAVADRRPESLGLEPSVPMPTRGFPGAASRGNARAPPVKGSQGEGHDSLNVFMSVHNDCSFVQWTPLGRLVEMIFHSLQTPCAHSPTTGIPNDACEFAAQALQDQPAVPLWVGGELRSVAGGSDGIIRLSDCHSFHVRRMPQQHGTAPTGLDEVPVAIALPQEDMEWADLAVQDVFNLVDGVRTVGEIITALASDSGPFREDQQQFFERLTSPLSRAMPNYHNLQLLSVSCFPESTEFPGSAEAAAAAPLTGLHGAWWQELEPIVKEALQHLTFHNYVRVVRPIRLHSVYRTTKALFSVLRHRAHPARHLLATRMLQVYAEVRQVSSTMQLTKAAPHWTLLGNERRSSFCAPGGSERDGTGPEEIGGSSVCRIADPVSFASLRGDGGSDRAGAVAEFSQVEISQAASASLCALGKFTNSTVSAVRNEMKTMSVWSEMFGGWEEACFRVLVEVGLLNGWLKEMYVAPQAEEGQ